LYDCYLFDLDNCLIHIPNPGEYFDNVLFETLKKLSSNGSLPGRSERNTFWFSGDKYLELLEKWGVSDGEFFWKYFDEIDFKNRKILLEKDEIFLYDDVLGALKKLSSDNKKIGLISNTANYIADFFLDKFGLSQYFHETFALGYDKDQEFAKPSPLGILQVLKKLDFDPENASAMMIGDSRVDIFAAKRANITSCLIKRDPHKYPHRNDWEAHPDFEIEKLDDLFRISWKVLRKTKKFLSNENSILINFPKEKD